jgi:phospholipid-transporting ATPase
MNKRQVLLSHQKQAHLAANRHYPNNKVQTSKYTPLTFLPLNLFNQFKKAANVYFLCISYLQTLKSISISNGKSVMIYPLALVVMVSMIKDAVEDYKRHCNDAQENEGYKTWVYRGGVFQKIRWQDLHVGEVIRIDNEKYVPADVVILSSSGPQGVCYIETKNLDGETNLKLKGANKMLQEYFTSPDTFRDIDGEILCEKPNNAIYKFEGTIRIPGAIDTTPLSADNLLLRGSSLRNTEFIYGLVVFTGHDTKVMQNSAKAKYKFSDLEYMTNKAIVIVLFTQIILSTIGGYLGSQDQVWAVELWESAESGKKRHVDFIKNFFTWILIFTNLVPISLMVSLELVKFFQAIFMGHDLRMFDAE